MTAYPWNANRDFSVSIMAITWLLSFAIHSNNHSFHFVDAFVVLRPPTPASRWTKNRPVSVAKLLLHQTNTDEESLLEQIESHTTVERDPDTQKPTRQQMVYVDEYNCIGCTACALIANSTFCMEQENGRARVFQQWGNDEGTIQVAIETCPVDCIHYVPYDELKQLEIERRDQIVNFKARLVGSIGTGQQSISGNKKMRCPNCPTRGCDDCPMFLIADSQPKYDVIGPVEVPVRGRQRQKVERAMKKLVSEEIQSNYKIQEQLKNNKITTETLSAELFDSIDLDGDGLLQKNELVRAGISIDVISLLDFDKNGSVGRDEFLSALKLVNNLDDLLQQQGSTAAATATSAAATSSNNTTTANKEKASSIVESSSLPLSSKTTETTLQTDRINSAQSNELSEELDLSLGELQPLERQELRLAGFEPYVLISVLTAESSYETIKEYDADWSSVDTDMATVLQMVGNFDAFKEYVDSTQIFNRIEWLVVGIQLASAGSAICGIYSTVVFCLVILYGKTALGLDRDEEYFLFMENSGLQRFRAFKSFSYGLLFWAISLCLVVCDHAPLIFQLPLLAASAALLAFAKREYDVITASAAPMFLPRKWKR